MKITKRMLIMFLTPAIVSYALIFLYPTLRTVYLSFFDVTGFTGSQMEFRGVGNYVELFRTKLFVQSLFTLLKVWVIGGVAIFGLVFLFTALLNSGVAGKKFFRAIIYLPNLIPVVAMTTMWTQYIYNPRYGLLKVMFTSLGLDELAKIQWTALDMLFWSMLIAYIWGGVGWFLLIILAGVERIPADFYDAARIDGANQVQLFTRITMPLLRDVIRVALVMWSITVINLFAFPRTFTPVVQANQTLTPAIYLYQLAFGQAGQAGAPDVGKAAAVGVCLLLLVLVFSGIISQLIKERRLEY